MKRKLNREGKLLLVLMVMILIIILLMIVISVISMKDAPNNNIQNNIQENIDDKNEEDENIIKVIVDNSNKEGEPNNENNNGNQNPNSNQNNNYNNNNNSDNENGEENVNNNNNNDNKVNTTTKDKNTYYIKINNQANVVTVYKKDAKGKYTVPVKAMLCSIGTATPKSGVYRTSDMYTWRLLQGDVYGQYAVRITGHILFHSVPYTKKAKDTLEWWEYDKLGTDASLGCIRLTVEDAKWIYDNCPKGTQVEFYYSSDPGPLGKPTSKKISSYDEELKKWDPTDPDSKNPWKTYVETSNPTEENTVETSTQPVHPNNSQNVVNTNNVIDTIDDI